MKVLTAGIFALFAIQSVFAANNYEAYRLGRYNEASEHLVRADDSQGVADYYMGRLYLYGYGQLKNDRLALRYFEKSASKGYLPAQLLMGKYALLKQNDPVAAFTWFKKAAASDDISAKMYVAAAYLYGVGVKKNADAARQFYIDAAKSGNPIAQYVLARHFLSSRQASNKKLGLVWLNKSVSAGNPKAQVRLAELYMEGKLVPKNPDLAKQLLTKAAEQQFVPAYIQLGNLALSSQTWQDAMYWYQKGQTQGSIQADYALAKLYLNEASPLHSKTDGFRLMLKAAHNNYAKAQTDLAALYRQGIGIEQNTALADEWDAKAKKNKGSDVAQGTSKIAKWLTNGLSNSMENTHYQLKGIFSAWHNENALKNNIYNAAPQRASLSREAIFKPDFNLIQPDEISISDYYDALTSGLSGNASDKSFTYPAYPMNPHIEALQKQLLPEQNQAQTEMKKNPYAALINHLFQRAVVGDAEAQFALAQVYEKGIGLPQNMEQAILWYQNAAEQGQEGAEYTLGVLYLQKGSAEDYKTGRNILLAAAFKGNSHAQYILSRILKEPADGPVSAFDEEQALSMQYLAAANGYGPAQYDLAEYLARHKGADLSVAAQRQRIQSIRGLYASAAAKGVTEASLPLAFYNAMEPDKELQKQAFTVAFAEAEKGNGKAALLTGLLYDRGIGVEQDHARAMQWYQKSDAGPVSDFIVGTYVSEGRGIEKNQHAGMEMLRRAANESLPFAWFNLAVLDRQEGGDFLENLEKAWRLGSSRAGILLADYYLASDNNADKMQDAINIYTGLAQKGDQYAQIKLGYMLEKGLGSKVDYEQAEQWYLRSAVQGNALAQFLLGEYYQTGVSGKPDYLQALAWYQKAAKQLPLASVAEGFLYETVFDDYTNARLAYEQAVLQNNAIGQYDLALMLENGKGSHTELFKAAELYDKAARQGYTPAMTNLANMYFNGSGIEKNQPQAVYWYKKAAEQGDDRALYELGLLSETGVGTEIRSADALIYYKNAANKGNEKAMMALARMYGYGLGVHRNPEEANRFYETLAARNNGYAQYQLALQQTQNKNWTDISPEAMKLLSKASENGNYQAVIILQRLAALGKDRISYVEPVQMSASLSASPVSAQQLFMQAINAWNYGDEVLSHSLLKRLVNTYPDYEPGKKTWESIHGRAVL